MAVGSEDDAVRALGATLERFRGEPRQALGVAADASAVAVRAAFMDLCKRYHPAKFARHTPPTVRLANEVFLAIKRAYESVMQALAAPPAIALPAGARANTAPPAGPFARAATAPPADRDRPPLAPAMGRRPPPLGARPSGALPRVTPPTGVPRVGGAPAAAGPPAAAATVTPPARVRQPTVPGAAGPPASAAPLPARPRRVSSKPPAGKPPLAARSGLTPATGSTPPTPSSPVKPTGRAAVPDTAGAGRSRERFEQALVLLRDQRYTEARVLFAELAAESGHDPRYRAYLHYARGWEAFQLGKAGEARAEWQRALACDPALGLAKRALETTGVR